MKEKDNLAHIVVQITAVREARPIGSGTGFYYSVRNGESLIPLIITNKHVVEGADELQIVLSCQDEHGDQIPKQFSTIKIPNHPRWVINHPKKEIDLCAIIFGPILNGSQKYRLKHLWKTVTRDNILSDSDLSEITSIEDVIMIGYPIGLRDVHNNRPIFRKGITATHPAYNYNDKREFLIDIAAFPGSSGSPVFLYQPKMRLLVNGKETGGPDEKLDQLKFAGILYAGPMYNAEGEVVVEEVPTTNSRMYYTKVPTNLGIVISAKVILDFEIIVLNMGDLVK